MTNDYLAQGQIAYSEFTEDDFEFRDKALYQMADYWQKQGDLEKVESLSMRIMNNET